MFQVSALHLSWIEPAASARPRDFCEPVPDIASTQTREQIATARERVGAAKEIRCVRWALPTPFTNLLKIISSLLCAIFERPALHGGSLFVVVPGLYQQ